MQTTLRCGSALPGDTRGQRDTASGTTTSNSRGDAYPRLITNTPQALLPTRLRQAYINENAALLSLRTKYTEQQKTETFGNPMNKKNDDMIRLVGQNIGCLGVRSFGNDKQEQGKEWLITNDVDVCCWQEVGIAHQMLKHHERIQERLRDHRWNRLRISAANNKHEAIEKFQFGGTLTMAFNEVATRVHASGADEKGLGRWSWLLFEGHNGYRTRIISAYVPCRQRNPKNATVYAQHKRYFESKGTEGCPRTLMIIELTDLIQQWQRKGENIVLFIDCNENLIKNGEIQRLLTGDKCNLVDPIRHKHSHLTPPPTYHRNHTYPIDSVFVSQRLRHIDMGGWLCFGEGIGDHRAIFLDIPIQILLGENKFTIAPSQVRRLKCDDPRIVNKFNKLLEEQYISHNLLNKIEAFNKTFHTPLLPEEIEQLESFDRISTCAVRYADKHCRKLCMGQVPFSDVRQNAGEHIALWKLVIRKKQGCNVSSKLISNLSKKLEVKRPMNLQLKDCYKERNNAYKRYKDIKKKAKEHRRTFQDKLHDDYERAGNDEMCKAIKNMKTKEETRHTHRRIKNATKPFGGSVHRLNIADTGAPGGRRTTTDPMEIQQALMTEYEQKYRLVYSTPFLQYPLRDEIGDQGLSQATEEILLGEYTPPIEIDRATETFLTHSKMHDNIINEGPNDDLITVKQCNEFWNKMKEKIQSSKSNKHVGTYKAATRNTTNSIIQARLMSIPYQTGYSLKRWQESLNVSLLKKQEKYTPEDLRTIWYMEADCNGGSKIHFARRMMHRALDNGLLSESQYAQKKKQAIDAGLVKVLFLDHLRITKTAGSLTMNDLMQCFDRMSHGAVSIASRRLGVGPRVIQSMLTTIQKMKHYIRTAYGDSRECYGNDNINPLQGGGQGNGASMPFFVALTAIIIPILEEQVDGLRILTAISLICISYIVIVYVDDSDFLIAARSPNEKAASIVRRTQKASDVWRDQVHNTGGAIRPHKCRWALVDFKWRNGQAFYKLNHEVDGDIYIKDTNGTRQRIQRLEPYESEQGLGLHIPVDGSQGNQVNNIINKSEKWIKGVQNSALSRKEIYVSLLNAVSKTITYSFTATSINETEMRKISTPLYKVALPRMGILPTLPLPYRYASSRYQGIDMNHFPTEQIIKKLDAMVYHGNQKTQVGRSISMCLEDIQLETGLIGNIFDYEYSKFGFLTQPSWLRHLWHECDKHGIALNGKYAQPQLTRENDFCLMERLCNSNHFTKQQILIINRCRIYLQVITLADISDSSGGFVTEYAYAGNKSTDRNSKYVWPNQIKPPPRHWILWRDAIELVWSGSGNHRIQPPLGNWTQLPHQHFLWMYSRSEHALYYHYTNSIKKFVPSMIRTRQQRIFRGTDTVNETPYDAEYATVKHFRDNEVIFHGSHPIRIPANYTAFHSFAEYIKSLPNETQRLLEHASFPDDGIHIANSIRNRKALGVTDASYEPDTNVGAAAWIIVGEINEISCEGRIGQQNTKTKTDPYRAETLGILGMLTALEHLCIYHKITSGEAIISCDNDASLENGIDKKDRMKVNNSYFDLFWAIQEIRERIPITLKSEKVKGHQDDKKSRHLLTRTERLNCYVDEQSKLFRKWIESQDEYHPTSDFGDNNWSIWLNGQKLIKDIRWNIIDHIQGTAIKSHISKTTMISLETVEDIDWDMVEKSTKLLPINKRLWLLKHVSGFAPTASKMVHRNEWDNDLCPQCGICRETVEHLLECTQPEAIENKMKGILKLQKWLKDVETAPGIIECIIHALTAGSGCSFHEMTRAQSNDQELNNLISNAARMQDRIGWQNFTRGRISTKWRIAQDHFLRKVNEGKKRSSKTWCTNFLVKMYHFVYEQWEFRNAVIATATQKKASISERRKIEKEVRKQFEQGCGTLRPKDHHLLECTVDSVLKKHIKSQKYWIRNCTVSRSYTEESERNMLTGMRNIMTAWATVPD